MYNYLVLLFLLLTTKYCVSQKPLELADVLDYKYLPVYFNGTWISDTVILYPHGSSIYGYNANNNTASVLWKDSVLKDNFTFVSFSSDNKFALYVGPKKKTYRHSSEAQYELLDINTMRTIPIDSNNPLQLVEWCPVGHDLVFVKDNNLYYINESAQMGAITHDGIRGVVYNGVADWVYEEEVLSTSKAFWFSNDGKMLAYMKFNDTEVHKMSYIHYGDPETKKSQYPDVVTMRYPKAGTTNPIVELYVINFLGNSMKVQPSKFTFSGPSSSAILTDVTWTPQNKLSVTWTNRIQNHSNTFLCSIAFETKDSGCDLILDNQVNVGWVDLVSPVFNQKVTQFLQIIPLFQDNLRSYPQLVLFYVNGGAAGIPLTKGRTTVTKIFGWDEKNKTVYYQAVRHSKSFESHIYKVNTETKVTQCISCSQSFQPCNYAQAAFSTGFSYFTLICKGPGIPHVRVVHTNAVQNRSRRNKTVLLWETNDVLKKSIQHLSLPIHYHLDVPLADGFLALARLTLPRNLSTSGRIKYPMLLNVYGGPGSNIIKDVFSINFHTYLASKKEVIIVHIDARGSAYRSKEQESAVYRNLGRNEIIDQIAVVKYLTDHLNFIDKDNVAIWGWSYGGFTTAMVLATDHQNLFKCGVSVAPVTNFLYYDSIYTERYMGLPTAKDNEAGYNWTDVTRKVDNFANKSFLLMHGTGDDNVHYQQSMMLARALEAKDIFFYQQSYPDQTHSISSYQHHVYHTIDHFLNECLNLYSIQ